jgi:hypothetical protein
MRRKLADRRNLTIALSPQNMTLFLDSVRNLPFTNFELEIHSEFEYGTPQFIRFRERFGNSVHVLKVSWMWKCTFEGEWNFYQALEQLESLTIQGSFFSSNNSMLSRIPSSCLKNLKTLLIEGSEFCGTNTNLTPYVFQLFEGASELLTFQPGTLRNPDASKVDLGSYLKFMSASLDRRGMQRIKQIKLWRFYDSLSDYENNQEWFGFVSRILSSSTHLMLENVSSAMLESLQSRPKGEKVEFLNRVVSLMNFNWKTRRMEMPNLEPIHNIDTDPDVHQWDKIMRNGQSLRLYQFCRKSKM